MSLFEHLMETRSKLELAKMLNQEAVKNAFLETKVNRLENELFWLKVAIADSKKLPIKHGPIGPNGAGRPSTSPIVQTAREMKVGDFIELPYSRTSWAGHMTVRTGFKFSQRREGDIIRIWRKA